MTGFTSRHLGASEYALLPEFGIGRTDASKTEAGMDRALSAMAFDIAGLISRLATVRPAIVAFNGLRSAQTGARPAKVARGAHPQSIAGAEVYALPSTSTAARRYWDISYWHAPAEAVAARRG